MVGGTVGHGAPELRHSLSLFPMIHAMILRLTVHFVVFPSQALSDPDTPPFLLLKQAQRPVVIITKKVLWDHLEQRLWEYNVAVFVFVVGVSFRIMNPVVEYVA